MTKIVFSLRVLLCTVSLQCSRVLQLLSCHDCLLSTSTVLAQGQAAHLHDNYAGPNKLESSPPARVAKRKRKKSIRALVISDIHDNIEQVERLVAAECSKTGKKAAADVELGFERKTSNFYDYVFILGDFCRVNHLPPDESSDAEFQKCDAFTEKVLSQFATQCTTIGRNFEEQEVGVEDHLVARNAIGPEDDLRHGATSTTPTTSASSSSSKNNAQDKHHHRVLYIAGNHDRKERTPSTVGTPEGTAPGSFLSTSISRNLTNGLQLLDTDLAVAGLGGSSSGGYLRQRWYEPALRSEKEYKAQKNVENVWPFAAHPWTSDEQFGSALEKLLARQFWTLEHQKRREVVKIQHNHQAEANNRIAGNKSEAVVAGDEQETALGILKQDEDQENMLETCRKKNETAQERLQRSAYLLQDFQMQLILLTHTGPHVSSTAVYTLNETHGIHGGSPELTHVLMRHSSRVLDGHNDPPRAELDPEVDSNYTGGAGANLASCKANKGVVVEDHSDKDLAPFHPKRIPLLANIHGHIHPANGMDSTFPNHLKIINPGPLYLGSYAEVVFSKLVNAHDKKSGDDGVAIEDDEEDKNADVRITGRTPETNKPFKQVWFLDEVAFKSAGM
ncbi:unnamed protein product [Amoebophrya sp. A120]|nr:unnamed protein product [Amoebophrya sp. A120]|eukprot:GSA120T00022278001.1